MNLVHEGVLDPNEPDFRDEKREAEEARRERETLANIVAEMRREVRYGKDTYCGKRVIHRMEDVRVMQFCDRIEAAWKRDEERAIEHATRHAETVARDNCRDCIHNPNGKNYEPIGNAAATYAALVKIHDLTNALDEECGVDPVEIRDIARAALAEPARNCDVGTEFEQVGRFKEFCHAHFCDNCPCRVDEIDPSYYETDPCPVIWAQLPYEAEEGAGK